MSAGRDEVLALLRANGVIGAGGDWQLVQLAGGWSRHTHRLTDAVSGRSFIVRVRPPGALLDTDLEREYRVYAAVAAAGVPVPAVHALQNAPESALGGPYFVMDHAPGHSPLVWQAGDREALEANWRGDRSVATDVVGALAAIHDIPVAELGFLGPPLSFREAVGRWRAVYDKSAMVADPVVEEAFEWVLARDPGPVEPSLVHADFRIGNMLLHEQRVTAVIDWELAHLGDPLFDVGYAAMPYYAGKFVRAGSPLVGAFAEPEWFVAEYARRRGIEVDPETVRTYTVQGTLSLIAIIGIGLRRFADGESTDPRMAWNRFVIPGLRQDMVRLMGW
ncbi:phosphotransferase family protein [Pseudonocardia sp. GCM10023141]|uniref:phosphotransferase family protein n=1 Tax=Pseudonocardia sp. GCM10023141 TaxID=3252653 RepID=UPI0036183D41